MGTIDEDFQMKVKESKYHNRLKMRRKRSLLKRGKWFGLGWLTLSRPIAVEKKKVRAAAKSSLEVSGDQKN